MVAEFESDVKTSEALLKVKDAVDKSDLPTDLETDPEINELDFAEIPIMVVNISGEYNMDDLRIYAEFVQDKIENLSQISEARMSGDLEREVKINVDLLKMQSLQISFTDIETAIARENITMSGGELINNGNRRAIRVVGEFSSIHEICLLYTSPSPRDQRGSRMPSSA